MEGGVLPVLKHLPGYGPGRAWTANLTLASGPGRAGCSRVAGPSISRPSRRAGPPAARSMTAHIVYEAAGGELARHLSPPPIAMDSATEIGLDRRP